MNPRYVAVEPRGLDTWINIVDTKSTIPNFAPVSVNTSLKGAAVVVDLVLAYLNRSE